MRQKKLELVSVGSTGKTFGYKGELLLFMDEVYEDLIQKDLFLFVNQEGNKVPYKLESVHWANECRIKLYGVNSMEEAKSFTSTHVFLDSDVIGDIIPAKKEKKGYEELVNFMIIDPNNNPIGKIDQIEENQHQILAFLVLENGKDVIVPIHEKLIISLDKKKKELHLEIAEGLLEL